MISIKENDFYYKNKLISLISIKASSNFHKNKNQMMQKNV